MILWLQAPVWPLKPCLNFPSLFATCTSPLKFHEVHYPWGPETIRILSITLFMSYASHQREVTTLSPFTLPGWALLPGQGLCNASRAPVKSWAGKKSYSPGSFADFIFHVKSVWAETQTIFARCSGWCSVVFLCWRLWARGCLNELCLIGDLLLLKFFLHEDTKSCTKSVCCCLSAQ